MRGGRKEHRQADKHVQPVMRVTPSGPARSLPDHAAAMTMNSKSYLETMVIYEFVDIK